MEVGRGLEGGLKLALGGWGGEAEVSFAFPCSGRGPGKQPESQPLKEGTDWKI